MARSVILLPAQVGMAVAQMLLPFTKLLTMLEERSKVGTGEKAFTAIAAKSRRMTVMRDIVARLLPRLLRLFAFVAHYDVLLSHWRGAGTTMSFIEKKSF